MGLSPSIRDGIRNWFYLPSFYLVRIAAWSLNNKVIRIQNIICKHPFCHGFWPSSLFSMKLKLKFILNFSNHPTFIYCWVGLLWVRRQSYQCNYTSNNSKQHSSSYNIVCSLQHYLRSTIWCWYKYRWIWT